jgi:hypothetical protein
LSGFAPLHNEKTKKEKLLLFGELGEEAAKKRKNFRILEIGIGTGPNLEYYPSNTTLIGLDPNKHFEKFVVEAMEKVRVQRIGKH